MVNGGLVVEPAARKVRGPDLEVERSLLEAGHAVVAGVDETGWGAWAGPLSVGAAVIPQDQPIPKGLRDSKDLSRGQLGTLFDLTREWCTHWAVGHATHAECDEMGFSEARSLAACRALKALPVEPDHILVDGNRDFVDTGNTTCLVKGDAISISIAAASVLAKVVRDRIMRDLSRHFSGYGFESNKGYHSPHHRAALLNLGPSPVHRGSVRLRVKLQDLPMIGSPRHRRYGLAEPPPDSADYSELSRWIDLDGVTRPPTVAN